MSGDGRRRLRTHALLLLLAFSGLLVVNATAGPRTVFSGSGGALGGKVAATMRPLTAPRLAEPLTFSVILRLRNADELQERVNRNEVIPYEEMERLYLPLPADYEAVTQWLKSEGFTITRHDDSYLGVYARGSVAQVRKSLQVEMVGVTVDGEDYPAANSTPSLPAEIAAPVLGIVGLSPYLKLKSYARTVPIKSGKAVTRDGAQPTAVTTPERSYSPAQILRAYDATYLGFTGTGQNIAIVADVLPLTTDLTAFWSRLGITRTGSYVPLTPNGTPNTATTGADGDVEVALDTEWSSGIAPGANVRVYAAGGTGFGQFGGCFQQIINDIKAGTVIGQLSISYGLGEVDAGINQKSAFISYDNQYMLVMAGLGVSIFVATGDSGSSPNGTLEVSYYSSSPYVTAVGGTSLAVYSNGTYLGENAWGGSGGGSSVFFNRPAWQTGTGVPSGTGRLVPDVCLPADPTTGADLNFEGKIYDYDGNTSGYLEGGTSWSSPTWAGMAALINQSRASLTPARGSMGLLGPRIYPLIGTNNFFDVTTGNNTAYAAGVGYDETTGIGSPDMKNLLPVLDGPVVTSFAPTGATVGSTVVITGTGLTLVTSVKFNGTSAAFTVNSATQITATVPAGATTGAITVSNATVPSGNKTFTDLYTTTTSFTVLVSDLTIATAQAGTFTQADAGDTYTITVTNSGTGATSGTVTVVDTLPSGLTATGLTGAGWTVNFPTLTATRADPLAANGSYPALTLTVNVSSTAASSVTNTATVSGGGETNTSNDTSSTVTPITALTPSQAWRYQYFGTTANSGVAADSYVYAGDRLPNLLKYALNLNPKVPAVSPLTSDLSTGYLRLTVPRNPNASDVTFSVEVNNSNLTDQSAWTSTTTVLDQNTTSLLQVHDSVPASQSSQQFIRLRVTR